MLKALQGYKTVTGLATIIVALLFRDGTLGDGGTVSQIFQYVLGLLGGGMSVGGVISKVRREAVERVNTVASRAPDIISDVLLPATIAALARSAATVSDADKDAARKKSGGADERTRSERRSGE